MRFLVDAQLPPGLCGWLEERGHEAAHIAQVLSGETPDREVAALAVAESRVLVTKDDDFAGRHRQPGLVIVWLRIGNATNRALTGWLDQRWAAVVAAIDEGEALIEVR